MQSGDFNARWSAGVALLNHAYAAGDEAAFDAALEELNAGRGVPAPVMADIVKFSENLQAALARFRNDSRLAALAHRDIPDARLRLDHVVTMTEDAANRTLDLIERSAPLANASLHGANQLLASLDDTSSQDIRCFLEEMRTNFEAVRANLSEVILAQSYQDLTGQILRGVQRLIGEVQTALAELARVTGMQHVPERQAESGLEGPAIPGVTQGAVTGQSDVDDLMAGLGL